MVKKKSAPICLIILYLCEKKVMTYIDHPNSINGGDFTQETVNRLTVQAISVAPQEIK